MKIDLQSHHGKISFRTYAGERILRCGASIHPFTAKRSHVVPYLEHNKGNNCIKGT
jgi:hypothetical protein